MEQNYQDELEKRNQLVIEDIDRTLNITVQLEESLLLLQIAIEDIRAKVLNSKLKIATAVDESLISIDPSVPKTISGAIQEIEKNIGQLKILTQEYADEFSMFMSLIELVNNTYREYNQRLVDTMASWDLRQHLEHSDFLQPSYDLMCFENPLFGIKQETRVRLSSEGETSANTKGILESLMQEETGNQNPVPVEISKITGSSEELSEDDELIEYSGDKAEKVDSKEIDKPDTENQRDEISDSAKIVTDEKLEKDIPEVENPRTGLPDIKIQSDETNLPADLEKKNDEASADQQPKGGINEVENVEPTMQDTQIRSKEDLSPDVKSKHVGDTVEEKPKEDHQGVKNIAKDNQDPQIPGEEVDSPSDEKLANLEANTKQQPKERNEEMDIPSSSSPTTVIQGDGTNPSSDIKGTGDEATAEEQQKEENEAVENVDPPMQVDEQDMDLSPDVKSKHVGDKLEQKPKEDHQGVKNVAKDNQDPQIPGEEVDSPSDEKLANLEENAKQQPKGGNEEVDIPQTGSPTTAIQGDGTNPPFDIKGTNEEAEKQQKEEKKAVEYVDPPMQVDEKKLSKNMDLSPDVESEKVGDKGERKPKEDLQGVKNVVNIQDPQIPGEEVDSPSDENLPNIETNIKQQPKGTNEEVDTPQLSSPNTAIQGDGTNSPSDIEVAEDKITAEEQPKGENKGAKNVESEASKGEIPNKMVIHLVKNFDDKAKGKNEDFSQHKTGNVPTMGAKPNEGNKPQNKNIKDSGNYMGKKAATINKPQQQPQGKQVTEKEGPGNAQKGNKTLQNPVTKSDTRPSQGQASALSGKQSEKEGKNQSNMKPQQFGKSTKKRR